MEPGMKELLACTHYCLWGPRPASHIALAFTHCCPEPPRWHLQLPASAPLWPEAPGALCLHCVTETRAFNCVCLLCSCLSFSTMALLLSHWGDDFHCESRSRAGGGGHADWWAQWFTEMPLTSPISPCRSRRPPTMSSTLSPHETLTAWRSRASTVTSTTLGTCPAPDYRTMTLLGRLFERSN